MSVEYRIHIAATIKREHANLFKEIRRAYASQISHNAAQYMAKVIEDWDNGTGKIRDGTLSTFAGFKFPCISDDNKRWLIGVIYDEFKQAVPELPEIKFRIGKDIARQIAELRALVSNFTSEQYHSLSSLPYTFRDGMVWVCRGDENEAQNILRPFSHSVGFNNYDAVCASTEEFINKLEQAKLSPGFKQTFEFSTGCIVVDYDHTIPAKVGHYFKELGEEIRDVGRRISGRFGVNRKPSKPATVPTSNPASVPSNPDRKFKCPQCAKVMILTSDEYFRNIYSCPYCQSRGIRPQGTADYPR